MKTKAIIPLVIGLGVGLIAIKLVMDVVQRAKGASASGDAVSVVMAATEIPVGAEITANMVKLGKAPRGLLPAHFEAPEQLVGRVARFSMLPEVVVQPTMLAPLGTPPGLGVRIPPGHRAVAVKVDEFSSVAGFLRPGSRVDVIAVLNVNKKGRQTETISRTILQNIEVAAVGQQLSDQSDGNTSLTRSVTLLVKPDQAAQLHLAATKGKIRLAMRNQEDQIAAGSRQANESELLGYMAGTGAEKGFLASLLAGLHAPQPVVKPAKGAVSVPPQPVQKAWPVTVIRGDDVEEIFFASHDSFVRVGAAVPLTGRTSPRMPMSDGRQSAPYGTQPEVRVPADNAGDEVSEDDLQAERDDVHSLEDASPSE